MWKEGVVWPNLGALQP